MQHHLEAHGKILKLFQDNNQILLAPGCDQEDLVAYCQERYPSEAYSPLGTGGILKWRCCSSGWT